MYCLFHIAYCSSLLAYCLLPTALGAIALQPLLETTPLFVHGVFGLGFSLFLLACTAESQKYTLQQGIAKRKYIYIYVYMYIFIGSASATDLFFLHARFYIYGLPKDLLCAIGFGHKF